MAKPTPSTPTQPSIPANFLKGPPPEALTCNRVDFSRTSLSEYDGCYATIIDNALTPAECATLLRLAASTTGETWERAMVNVGGGRQVMETETRKCGRVIWDSPDMAARLWERVRPFVPELEVLDGGGECTHVLSNSQVRRGEKWVCAGLNERLRFLKYVEGEYFRPHCDGAYIRPDGSESSFFTMHLYLNDANTVEPGGEPLEGGATTFHAYRDFFAESPERLDVEPKLGRVLLFQHRELLHSGDDVVKGTKYTMRSDIMYRFAPAEE